MEPSPRTGAEAERPELAHALPDAPEAVAVRARHDDEVGRAPAEVLGDLARERLVALDAVRVRADRRRLEPARRGPAEALGPLAPERPARPRRRAPGVGPGTTAAS